MKQSCCKWHQVGLSLFNYQGDARSKKHKTVNIIYKISLKNFRIYSGHLQVLRTLIFLRVWSQRNDCCVWTFVYPVTVNANSTSYYEISVRFLREKFTPLYRGADNSLTRPGRKQARKHVREARDFNQIETRAVIKFLFLQGKAQKEIHAILTETLACFLPGWAKDLSALLYNMLHPILHKQ